jgi:hypothetical protein
MDCRCDIYIYVCIYIYICMYIYICILNFNCHCFVVCLLYMCPILEAPHPGRQTKQGLYIKTIYSSVNRGIYGHMFEAHRGWGHYIPRSRVTKEYIALYPSVTRNRGI